jgi:hypothetical protein
LKGKRKFGGVISAEPLQRNFLRQEIIMEIQLYELLTTSYGETNGTGKGDKQTNGSGVRRKMVTVAYSHYVPSFSLCHSITI